MFHPLAFLKTVHEVYKIVVLGLTAGLSMLLIEAQVFLMMLAACLIVPMDIDGNPTIALFKLYPGFKVNGSVPSDHIIQHEGVDCLCINYLEPEA
ncbi:hypothetical protein J3R82DRAFT_8660 [Butyriboletus roseoflavus]|nr:hypothetical protein J3R82DRAFT_8660 [Butyriboletus roseoflavus]